MIDVFLLKAKYEKEEEEGKVISWHSWCQEMFVPLMMFQTQKHISIKTIIKKN
jgi:hypothetical protein